MVVCLSQEQYRGLELILKKCLGLLKVLARGNDVVQMRIFERLNILLKIKVVESDVAVALKEVQKRLTISLLVLMREIKLNPLKPSGAKWLHLRASRAILV